MASFEQVYAPLDIAGPYSNVAKTMVGAGQVVNQAFQDWDKLEKSKEKDRIRRQAISEIIQKKPALAQRGLVTENTTLEDLGKGLKQIGEAEMLWSRLEKAGVPLPPKADYEVAAFGSSEKAWDRYAQSMAKAAEEAEKTKGQSETFAGMREKAGEVLAKDPGASSEQLMQAATQAQAAGTATPEQIKMLQGMATSELDRNKLAQKQKMDEARLGLARAGLKARTDKMKKDTEYQEYMTLLRGLAAKGDFSEMRARMAARADSLRTKAEVLRTERFNEAAAKEAEEEAIEWDNAAKYSQGNDEWMQRLVSELGAVHAGKNPAPAGAVPAQLRPAGVGSLGLTPPPR